MPFTKSIRLVHGLNVTLIKLGEIMRNFQDSIAPFVVGAVVVGLILIIPSGLEAFGVTKKPQILKGKIQACLDSAQQNKSNPFAYQLIQASNNCNGIIEPYNVAFPDAPVPNAPSSQGNSEATNTQGKPQGGQ
jgi:hypothetical protein